MEEKGWEGGQSRFGLARRWWGLERHFSLRAVLREGGEMVEKGISGWAMEWW